MSINMTIAERANAYRIITEQIYDLFMYGVVRTGLVDGKDKEILMIRKNGTYSKSTKPYDYDKAIRNIILKNLPDVSKMELDESISVIKKFMLKMFKPCRRDNGEIIGHYIDIYITLKYSFYEYIQRPDSGISIYTECEFNPKRFIEDILIKYIEQYDWLDWNFIDRVSDRHTFVNGSNDVDCNETFHILKKFIEDNKNNSRIDIKKYEKFLEGLDYALKEEVAPFKVPNISISKTSYPMPVTFEEDCEPMTNWSLKQWQKYFKKDEFNGQVSVGNIHQYILLMAKLCALYVKHNHKYQQRWFGNSNLKGHWENAFKIICENSVYFGNYKKTGIHNLKTGSGKFLGDPCDLVGGTRKFVLVPKEHPFFSQGTQCVLVGGSFIHNDPTKNTALTFEKVDSTYKSEDSTPFVIIDCKQPDERGECLSRTLPDIDWGAYKLGL